ncbi:MULTISPECIES: acyl-CoA dehydrogenase family protein [unclassified Sporosarcina]|uniref:acyl-CoA dehydrogenase family protein n=1 Tax=unclassified Sporosarcina TaxID=2647733 RepID=UPI000C164B9D|nr:MULTISPECIES: acyl-CoA dehydrogenase family protein [unclassified Sporosarcina]PID06521.1 acyl-CoA dehydrogenase [Sporosarcina sp. P30]PID09715.1 acyl-CoA dehydrogenase [Sporosarcina sp. P31]PID13293.1 acyl-CoA dehydrogenase [Sporosarcina sp. P32b]
MDFSLTEEQEMFRGHIRKMLDKFGGTQVAREMIDQNPQNLKKVYKTLAELGCSGINIPEEYDGMDLEALDLVPTFEEMGRSLVPGLFMETSALAVPILKKYATEEQKQQYLPAIASGEKWISFAALEPFNDFSPAGIHCTLQQKDGQYVLNGTKTLVPEAELADAFLVLVRTNQEDQEDGLSLLLIDKTDALNIEKQSSFDESKHVAKMEFENLVITQEQIIGEVDKGWTQLQEGLLYFNAALSSYIVGAMEQVVHMATEYAKIREQFGQAIGRFQAIKHSIVNMKVNLEIARSLSHYANWVVDTEEFDREAAVYSARTYATEKFIEVSAHNIQIHGGIGFTEEIDCHLYVKRARYYDQYLGSTPFYQEKVVASLGW